MKTQGSQKEKTKPPCYRGGDRQRQEGAAGDQSVQMRPGRSHQWAGRVSEMIWGAHSTAGGRMRGVSGDLGWLGSASQDQSQGGFSSESLLLTV